MGGVADRAADLLVAAMMKLGGIELLLDIRDSPFFHLDGEVMTRQASLGDIGSQVVVLGALMRKMAGSALGLGVEIVVAVGHLAALFKGFLMAIRTGRQQFITA